MHRAVLIFIVACAALARASIYECPSDSPCEDCFSPYESTTNSSDWYCLTIEENNFSLTFDDHAEAFAAGLDSVQEEPQLSYWVNFHNNTINYATYTETSGSFFGCNQNKLMGVTRGVKPITDKSCMFTWRETLAARGETAGYLVIRAYGWYNHTMKPWQTPGQNPIMAVISPGETYRYTIRKHPDSCSYFIHDKYMNLVANASTPQDHGGDTGLSAKFTLYFGGGTPAPQPVTVSYLKALDTPTTTTESYPYTYGLTQIKQNTLDMQVSEREGNANTQTLAERAMRQRVASVIGEDKGNESGSSFTSVVC